MADNHPAFPLGAGPIHTLVTQLRKSFPTELNADVLKKLGVAPNNESRLITVIRFLGFVDEQGRKTEEAGRVFSIHDDAAFQEAFSKAVQNAYAELFSLHQDETWTLERDPLIGYFRQANQSGDLVGKRQATVFQALAAIAGHGNLPTTSSTQRRATNSGRTRKAAQSARTDPAANTPQPEQGPQPPREQKARGEVNLTVRVEINLPAGGDQETYDRIFKSIRENLIQGE